MKRLLIAVFFAVPQQSYSRPWGNNRIYPLARLMWANNVPEIEKRLNEDPSLAKDPDPVGETPLHHVAFYGHNNLIEIFLNAGANIQARNKKDETPLKVAVANGRIETVRLLINKGALLDAHTIRLMQEKMPYLLPFACAHNYHNLRIVQNTLWDYEYKIIKAKVDSLQKERLLLLCTHYKAPNIPQLVRNQKRGVPFSPYFRPTNKQLSNAA